MTGWIDLAGLLPQRSGSDDVLNGIAYDAARKRLFVTGKLAAPALRDTLGRLPTREHLAMERFFDESGGTQLVIHTPYGSRVNRAWGLALRKRFCRTFNFELQAAATENALILSLGVAMPGAHHRLCALA